MKTTPWPYPLWIAHRGAGKLAPENTLTSMRVGHAHGYRMFEFDVKLSADGFTRVRAESAAEREALVALAAGALESVRR